VVTNW